MCVDAVVVHITMLISWSQASESVGHQRLATTTLNGTLLRYNTRSIS